MTSLLNDPRITAYALGELSPEEKTEFEVRLEREDSDTQELIHNEINLIKKQAVKLSHELRQSKQARLDPEQIETIASKTYEKDNRWIIWLAGFSSIAALSAVLWTKSKPLQQQDISQVNTPVAEQDIVVQDDVKQEEVEQDEIVSATQTQPQPEIMEESIIASKAQPSSKSDTNIAYNKPAMEKRANPSAATQNSGKSLQTANEVSLGKSRTETYLVSKKSVASPSSLQLPQKMPIQTHQTEDYDEIKTNKFILVQSNPLSTFSIDVDTASYSNSRRFLNQGLLPPQESIRIEEFINYFDYKYKAPKKSSKDPFATHIEIAQSPFHPEYKIVRIGMKGKEMLADEAPPSNLVFLIDVSGSMEDHNKLPLVKEAMKLLTRKLTEKDKVSIVVYAGASGLVLKPTAGNNKQVIFSALTNLKAGGSTNGSAGIDLAYQTAKENFITKGNNRVILVTDGDFNLGTTSKGGLVQLIKDKAKEDIFLTVLGVGMGNYKDSTLEKLADEGNGHYAYLDSINEAKKVLVQDRFKTLHTIAKDVKIQVEFNPSKVQAYRLIGYENRLLKKQDFNDDSKDAGEIGAGHTVTALYEIVPPGVDIAASTVDPLRYQKQRETKVKSNNQSDEILFVKVRYKDPLGKKSKKLEFPLKDQDHSFAQASEDFRFATAVAGFAMALKKDPYLGDMNLKEIIKIAKKTKGHDEFELRQEFIENVELARQLLH
ncbi:MAG: VWA domain-containing protein [Bdellovibrionota bacterium]